jgi:hypothetical protein
MTPQRDRHINKNKKQKGVKGELTEEWLWACFEETLPLKNGNGEKTGFSKGLKAEKGCFT